MSTKESILVNQVTADGLITGSSGVSTTTVSATTVTATGTVSGATVSSTGDVIATGDVQCTNLKPKSGSGETNYISMTTGNNDMYYVANTHYTTGDAVFINNVRAPLIFGPSPAANNIQLNGGGNNTYYNAASHVYQDTGGGTSTLIKTPAVAATSGSNAIGFNNSNETHHFADAHVFFNLAATDLGLTKHGQINMHDNPGSFRQIGTTPGTNTSLVLTSSTASGEGGNIELLNTGNSIYDADTHTYRLANGSDGTQVEVYGNVKTINSTTVPFQLYKAITASGFWGTEYLPTISARREFPGVVAGAGIEIYWDDLYYAGYNHFKIKFEVDMNPSLNCNVKFIAEDPVTKVTNVLSGARYYGGYQQNGTGATFTGGTQLVLMPSGMAGGQKTYIVFETSNMGVRACNERATVGGPTKNLNGPCLSWQYTRDAAVAGSGAGWLCGDALPGGASGPASTGNLNFIRGIRFDLGWSSAGAGPDYYAYSITASV